MKGITNEEKEVLITIKLNLFTIGTTTLLKPKKLLLLNVVIFNAEIVLKISCSISDILKEKLGLIILQHALKSQNWILYVGHYQKISK
jgi:hypothetical protein